MNGSVKTGPRLIMFTFWRGRGGLRWRVRRERICKRCNHSDQAGRWSGRTCQAAGQSRARAPGMKMLKTVFVQIVKTLPPGGRDQAQPCDWLRNEPCGNNVRPILFVWKWISSKLIPCPRCGLPPWCRFSVGPRQIPATRWWWWRWWWWWWWWRVLARYLQPDQFCEEN